MTVLLFFPKKGKTNLKLIEKISSKVIRAVAV